MLERTLYLARCTADGFRNMAVDEHLFGLCRRGILAAALRFYEWEPPAVSLGYSQAFGVLDLEKCRKRGVDVVRRMSGGGAILHCEELTYCLVLGLRPERRAPRPTAVAGVVAEALLKGLQGLGVEASVNRRGGTGKAGGSLASNLCFMSGAENEIQVSGRKLVGCAHKCTREAFFSHGSVIVGPGHLNIAELVKERPAWGVLDELRQQSTSLAELLDELPPLARMELAFREAFEGVLGFSLEDGRLSEEEERCIESCAHERRG